jgi:hypothetical protein
MLFGYELELFVTNKKGDVVVPRPELSSVVDGGGILVEARSLPMPHPKLAEASLKIKLKELYKLVRKNKRGLLLSNEETVSPASLRYARTHKKSYDFDEPVFERFRNPVKLVHRKPGQYQAGLHIHFSKPSSYDAKKFEVFDILYPIRLLDQEFEEEIKAAHRHPGAYQMKDYGVEYRSLPATIKLSKVTKVLEKMLAPREFEMYPDNEIPDDEDEL